MKNLISRILHLSLLIKLSIIVAIVGGSWTIYSYFFSANDKQETYQTSTVERGTLINSITASGNITSGDTTYITTGATGTVSKVYVKNGDTVSKGQKIAEVQLDEEGQETQTTAWNNYQEALVRVKESQVSKLSNDINVDEKYQAVIDAERAQRDAQSGGWNPDTRSPYTENELKIVIKEYEEAKLAYDSATKDYSISDTNIALAQVKASAAYRSYQQVSRTITAPASGILNNLTLAPGVVISDTSSSSITVSTGTDSTSNSQSVTSQKIGAIKNPEGHYQATINLTETDVIKVKSGQKVTLTLDSYPDKTLTGEVLAVNTSGSVNSGVTSYSAIILLDKTNLDIYTNMAVNSTIIISFKDNILLLPSTSIQNSNGETYVQVLVDGSVTQVPVETGESNDTQTEIISGISEGDTVVTGKSTKSTKSTGSGTVFGNSNNGGMRIPMGGPGF